MIDMIHDKLKGYIDNQDISGAGIIVRRGGKAVHQEYLGAADIAGGRPMKPGTVFRLASMTKPVVGVAIMMMVEQGKLSLDDCIDKYIPAFAEMEVAEEKLDVGPGADMEQLSERAANMKFTVLERPITVEDLLRHRSGLGQGIVSMQRGINSSAPGITLEQRAEAIAGCPMDFQPGKGVGYSAVVGFDILGRILEIVSGKPLDVLLDELLFAPLGMKDTTFWPSDDQKARAARMYSREKGFLEDFAPVGEFRNPFNFSFPCGSAGLHSTLEDYDKFVQMLASGGVYEGRRYLREETLRQMAAPCPEDPPMAFPGSAWGLSMSVFEPYDVSRRYLAKGTFGWSGAFGTHFYIDPVNDVTMVFVTNRLDIGGAGSYVSWGMEEAIFKGLELKDR